MSVWVTARATYDLDIVADDGKRREITSALLDVGFRVENDAPGFTNLTPADPKLGPLDFLWVRGSTSRQVLGEAVEKPGPDGEPLLVVKPEHLVAMKIQAVRDTPTRVFRYAEDLRLLLALPDIDENRCREYFAREGLGELFDRIKQGRL
jgi:hypothetical protein